MKIVNLDEEDFHKIVTNSWERTFAISAEETTVNYIPIARLLYYKGNNITIEHSPDKSIPDSMYFIQLLNTIEAIKHCKEHYYTFDESLKLPPNQVHGMYATWLDYEINASIKSAIKTNANFHDIIVLVKQGLVIMANGVYAGKNGDIISTTNCIVGYDDESNMLLLADPYGDYHTQFENRNGYLVTMTEREFVNHIQPAWYSKKYIHVPIV